MQSERKDENGHFDYDYVSYEKEKEKSQKENQKSQKSQNFSKEQFHHVSSQNEFSLPNFKQFTTNYNSHYSKYTKCDSNSQPKNPKIEVNGDFISHNTVLHHNITNVTNTQNITMNYYKDGFMFGSDYTKGQDNQRKIEAPKNLNLAIEDSTSLPEVSQGQGIQVY